MLIAGRNGMLVGGKSLPYDAEIEYLQGDGRSYINTGVYTGNDIGISVTAQRMIDLTSDAPMFGARYDALDTRFFIGAQIDNKFYFGWNSRIDYGTVDYGVHVFSMNYLNDRKAKLDGVEAGMLSSNIDYSMIIPLFAYNRIYIIAAYGIYWRIFRFKMTQGAALVRDFIPVRVGQVGYMYDMVSNSLFGNAGTGAFILGPDL